MKKTLLIVVIIIAFIVVAAAFLVSPIAKNYILKHDKELTGRHLTIDKLRINIFTGSLTIENAVMYESNDTAHFVSVGRFETRVRYLPIIKNRFVITRTLIDKAEVYVSQNGSSFNFDDIISHFADTTKVETETAEQPSSWSIDMRNIDLKDSQVIYKDLAVGADWQLDNLTFNIPSVYFSDQSTDVGLNLALHNGGSLKSSIEYKMESGRYKLSLELKDFVVESMLPYVRQFIDAGSIGGVLGCNMVIDGDIDHVMSFNVSGVADMKDFVLQDENSADLIRVKECAADIDRLNLEEMIFAFNKLSASGIEGRFDVSADGKSNFAAIMKESPSEATDEQTDAAPVVPMKLYVKQIAVDNSSLTYTDNSLSMPFTYAVTDISVSGENITPAENNSIKARATLSKKGYADIVWRGNPSSIDNHNISLSFTNVDLTEFTPFSVGMFGHPLTNGTLSFTSHNIINDRNLNCINKLDIHRCEVGKKDKTVKAEYSVPLKLGLYVLKDKHDRIAMEIPVKGNLDSPEFSYRKIVIKTICNLLVKVATTPFSFLGGDDMNTIYFDLLQTEFTPAQYDKLKDLAAAIKDKPELKLTFTQYISSQKAVEQMSMNMLKISFISKGKADVDYSTLGLLDKAAVDNFNLKNPAFVKYADSLLSARNIKPISNVTAKAVALFGEQTMEKISKSCETRNVLIRDYLVSKEGLDNLLVDIKQTPADSLKEYRGKHKYHVSIDVMAEELTQE